LEIVASKDALQNAEKANAARAPWWPPPQQQQSANHNNNAATSATQPAYRLVICFFIIIFIFIFAEKLAQQKPTPIFVVGCIWCCKLAGARRASNACALADHGKGKFGRMEKERWRKD
jgi:hypothetical protein